jgi:hypothetical protein
MNYKEIESFKSILLQMVKQGCSIKNDDFSVDGRVAGVGFKPYWTYPTDSKINKLEFNILDNRGRIAPFYLYNIIGCDVTCIFRLIRTAIPDLSRFIRKSGYIRACKKLVSEP